MDSYSFDSFPFHIERLRSDDIIDTKLFSDQDMSYMRLESWCLVFDGDDIERYIERSNLLLMDFRIAIQYKGPVIKYRICKEDYQYCRRLNDPILHNYESGINRKIFDRSDIEKVDTYFGRLIEMNEVSHRTKNALYFTFRGMSAAKWIDAFMISSVTSSIRFDVTIQALNSFFRCVTSTNGRKSYHPLIALRFKIAHWCS